MALLRRIAHLDMDAFYASVELLRYPQLKGLPVVIGGGRRREDDLLGRMRVLQAEREWTTADLAEIPLEVFPRLNSYVGRGVITTATYAARAFGVGSAMGVMKAAKMRSKPKHWAHKVCTLAAPCSMAWAPWEKKASPKLCKSSTTNCR